MHTRQSIATTTYWDLSFREGSIPSILKIQVQHHLHLGKQLSHQGCEVFELGWTLWPNGFAKVCAKLLTTCVPLPMKGAGVTDMVSSSESRKGKTLAAKFSSRFLDLIQVICYCYWFTTLAKFLHFGNGKRPDQCQNEVCSLTQEISAFAETVSAGYSKTVPYLGRVLQRSFCGLWPQTNTKTSQKAHKLP